MKREILILLASLMTVGSGLAGLPEARAAGGHPTVAPPKRIDIIALREVLTKGLRITREDQKTYVNRVIALVAQGTLPLSYVYASFRSARKRRPDYPYPYFKYTLNGLAKRRNIEI